MKQFILIFITLQVQISLKFLCLKACNVDYTTLNY